MSLILSARHIHDGFLSIRGILGVFTRISFQRFAPAAFGDIFQYPRNDPVLLLRPIDRAHALQSLNLTAFQLGIATGHENSRIRRHPVQFPDYVPALFVRMFRHRTRVHEEYVRPLRPLRHLQRHSALQKPSLISRGLRIVQLTPQSNKRYLSIHKRSNPLLETFFTAAVHSNPTPLGLAPFYRRILLRHAD